MQLFLNQNWLSIHAELLKLKRTPILWISLIGGLFTTVMVFIIFLAKYEALSDPEYNSWIVYYHFGYVMITMLLAIPYVILLNGSLFHYEHVSSSWKYLYSLPVTKQNIYLSKLLISIALLVLTHLLFVCSVIISGYVLEIFRPSYQFIERVPPIGMYVKTSGHSILSLLGIVAIQFWLSLRWKNFIIPIAIGMSGFIIALFLLFVKRMDLAAYWPYAYPGLIGFEYGPDGDPTGLTYWGGITNVEWISLGCLVFFGFVGYWEEAKSNVK